MEQKRLIGGIRFSLTGLQALKRRNNENIEKSCKCHAVRDDDF